MMRKKKPWFIVKKYKKLPKDVEKQASRLSKICFSFMEETEEQKKLHNDKFYNNKAVVTVLALENNQVVGRAKVIKRNIEFGGVSIVLGGLGGVCTLPEKRRKGIATAVVKLAFAEPKNQECDIAYLCTDLKNPHRVGLYSQVGFIPFGKPHQFHGQSGKIYVEYDAMLAPVNSKEKFDLVMKGTEILDIGYGNW